MEYTSINDGVAIYDISQITATDEIELVNKLLVFRNTIPDAISLCDIRILFLNNHYLLARFVKHIPKTSVERQLKNDILRALETD